MVAQPDREHGSPRPRPGTGAPELPWTGRRPSPAPRSTDRYALDDAGGSTFFDRPIDEEDERRSGVWTLIGGLPARLRSNPRTVRHGSVAVIGAGVALFVAASLATPLASAETKNGSAAAGGHGVLQLTAPTAAATSSNLQLLDRRPTHAKQQAPVDHGTISGLAANGIPKVALNAYRVAAARLGHVSPGCGIDWALLAGIGREESDHGRFGGATLHADGTSTPRIVGPALDGRHWDLIPAPSNGIDLAGDATYAHALGPMQFIPSTWATYGADANGDGKADIFNINDAALGAARYLCAAGGDLRTHAGQVKAVLAYNHSDQYLAQVLALADAYRRGVPVTGIPVGNITGALPTVKHTGNPPPVNPAAPTAADKEHKTAAKKAAKKSAKKSAAATPTKSTGAKKSTPNLEPTDHPTTSGSHSSSSPSLPTGPSGPSGDPSSGQSSSEAPSTDAPASSDSNTCSVDLGPVCIPG